MHMIFKKGDGLNPRGISVINYMFKLYDMVMCERLSQWFRSYRELTGAQKARGCPEHIVTLRLLIDTPRRKKYQIICTFCRLFKSL